MRDPKRRRMHLRRLMLVPHYRVPVTPLSYGTTCAAAGFGLWQGIAIMASKPERFSSASFDGLRNYMFHFGAAAAIFGVLILAGLLTHSFVIKGLGLTGLAVWSLAFCSVTLKAFLVNLTAGPTGPPAYFFIAIVLAILVWMDERKPARAITKVLSRSAQKVHRLVGDKARRSPP